MPITEGELAEIRARVAANMPRSVIAEYYRKDVPKLLTLVAELKQVSLQDVLIYEAGLEEERIASQELADLNVELIKENTGLKEQVGELEAKGPSCNCEFCKDLPKAEIAQLRP